MKLTHLIDPTRIPSEHNRSKIHYQALDGKELLCGLGHVYREIDGDRYQIWYPTKREVTCLSCTRALEAIVRFQLNGLSSEQLEVLLTHIESFRVPENGTGTGAGGT